MDFVLCLKSNKYVSTTEKFSFRYPSDYPISLKTGDKITSKYYISDEYVIWVNFSKEFYVSAGGDRLGSIIVKRDTSYQSVREFGDKTLSDFDRLPAPYKGTTPEVEYLKVGDEDAVRITTSSQPASFDPPSDTYIFIHNGDLYRISFEYDSYYHKLPIGYYQKGKELILSTFTFNQ